MRPRYKAGSKPPAERPPEEAQRPKLLSRCLALEGGAGPEEEFIFRGRPALLKTASLFLKENLFSSRKPTLLNEAPLFF